MIRAALFDIGNVIVPFDFSPAMVRLGERGRQDSPAGWAGLERIKLAYEGGRIDRAAFLNALRAEVAFTGPDEELVAIWSDVFAPNPPMDALIEQLHAEGLLLFLLSNTSDIHVDTFTSRFPIFGRFAGAIYSHEERLMKPDPEMFRRAIERFGLIPAETIYVDDLAPNIEAAAALGFVALQYDARNHAAFEREFRALLRQDATTRGRAQI